MCPFLSHDLEHLFSCTVHLVVTFERMSMISNASGPVGAHVVEDPGSRIPVYQYLTQDPELPYTHIYIYIDIYIYICTHIPYSSLLAAFLVIPVGSIPIDHF